ncbi:hypothetical protein MKW94_019804 [Papaver nudicaule]|uniref:Barwin domain-containing protein n=1 Tax=Papaver nudicaule TaxID=74823 RepID=A0AA41V632_PAPNU|nr:hypothetical protein [Papaver nudicaule]
MATKQLSTIFLLFFPTTIVGIVNGQSPTNVRAMYHYYNPAKIGWSCTKLALIYMMYSNGNRRKITSNLLIGKNDHDGHSLL